MVSNSFWTFFCIILVPCQYFYYLPVIYLHKYNIFSGRNLLKYSKNFQLISYTHCLGTIWVFQYTMHTSNRILFIIRVPNISKHLNHLNTFSDPFKYSKHTFTYTLLYLSCKYFQLSIFRLNVGMFLPRLINETHMYRYAQHEKNTGVWLIFGPFFVKN